MKYQIKLRDCGRCDVAVAGGGMAGVMAALASAKMGADTLLVEEQAFVGGQATAGGVHTFCGETRLVNDPWREMLDRLRKLDGLAPYDPNHDGRAFDCEALKYVLQEMLREAGVRLLLHTRLVEAERRKELVTALILHNKSGLSRLACSQVIDATGDADVVARGGLPYLRGGPVLAPGEHPGLDAGSPHRQLPMSLYFTMVESGDGEEVRPVLPSGCPTYGNDADLPMITVIRHGRLITVKMKVIGFDVTDGASLSEAEQEARRQMMGVVYHLQAVGYRGRAYPAYRLAWVYPHIGIREGRRVVARYVLTAADVLEGRHHRDAVAVGSYHVDYHWPNVVQRAGTGVTTQCPPYQIPFRSMRPAAVRNLLVPGRCLSGEQMAMSSFRVMGTCAQTGFAAGAAAALAVRRREALDEIDQAELRSELRRQGLRLDLAPYYNYLRRRRSVDEIVAAVDAEAVGCVGVDLLPNGDVVAAWSERRQGRLYALAAVRREERWLEPVTVGVTESAFVLLTDSRQRLSFDHAGAATVIEEDSPGMIYLAGGRYTYTSGDGGVSWSQSADSVQDLSGGSAAGNEDLHLFVSPGDPPLALRCREGRLEISRREMLQQGISGDAGGSLPRSYALKDVDLRVRPSVSPSADGVVVVYLSTGGTLKFQRISSDVLAGTGDNGQDWHHNDASWIDLLAGHSLEPEQEPRDE